MIGRTGLDYLFRASSGDFRLHQARIGSFGSFLACADTALMGLADAYRTVVKRDPLEPTDRYLAFLRVLDRDAADSLAVLQLVIAQPSLNSQTIDNLNVSITSARRSPTSF